MEWLVLISAGFIAVGSIWFMLWKTERYMWKLFRPILEALEAMDERSPFTS